MRISEAARMLGTSPRMLRYRETLGLLPRGSGQRRYTDEDLATVRAAFALERRYDVSPAALAFGLRVLADPAVANELRELGTRTGALRPRPSAADIDRERALQWLGRSGMLPPPRTSGHR